MTRDQQIRRMHAQGLTMTDIGVELGVSRQRVAQLADRLGLAWAKAMPEAERWKRLPALLRQGLTYGQIAERLGVHEQVIAKDLRTMPHGKRLRKEQRQAKPSGKRREKIPALIEKGLSAPQIAERLGVVTSTIYRDLAWMKLPAKLHRKRMQNGRDAQARALRAAVMARVSGKS